MFTFGSFLCGISSNIHVLVACRILQGCGGAMMVPVGRLTIVRTFAKSKLIRAMSFVAIPGLVGPMLGPIAGGLIVGYLHRRVIFFALTSRSASWVYISLIGICRTIGKNQPTRYGRSHPLWRRHSASGWPAVGNSACSFSPLPGRGVFKALQHGIAAAKAADGVLRGTVKVNGAKLFMEVGNSTVTVRSYVDPGSVGLTEALFLFSVRPIGEGEMLCFLPIRGEIISA